MPAVAANAAPGPTQDSTPMEARAMLKVLRALGAVMGLVVVAVALSPLAYATLRHEECATIPDSVGPCDYWGRLVWLIGPQLAWAEVVLVLAIVVVAVAVFARGSRLRRDRIRRTTA
ncbi:hypothetical protein [Nocardia carnea]|uniref:hypothetical protein n=1 Tax=Nocardia carnea TaxID=37328 RepID=UPI002458CC8A|nr:hypothetical protein [Nocardia carnea]